MGPIQPEPTGPSCRRVSRLFEEFEEVAFGDIDDRNTRPDPALAPVAVWTYEHNAIAWEALLGNDRGGLVVSSILAPARLENGFDLAPTYLEIGGGDIFRDKCLSYAALLVRHNVDVEFHLHAGVVHAADRLAPTADVTLRQFADRDRVIRRL